MTYCRTYSPRLLTSSLVTVLEDVIHGRLDAIREVITLILSAIAAVLVSVGRIDVLLEHYRQESEFRIPSLSDCERHSEEDEDSFVHL